MPVFFLFKQKTAYEMRISDLSSDVCSSDLPLGFSGKPFSTVGLGEPHLIARHDHILVRVDPERAQIDTRGLDPPAGRDRPGRSEERRVGTACVSTRRSRRSPFPTKTQ